jgi:uncharacterized membrane protein
MSSRTLFTGFGIGAMAAYLLDPDRGARRRGLIRDKLVSAGSTAEDAIDATRRDVANRARGVVASLRLSLRRGDRVDDVVLAERVRARLGGVVSHPGSIDVAVCDGHVTLCGPIFSGEAPRLLKRVASVRGVRSVEDQLDKRDSAGDEPGLQPGPVGRRTGQPTGQRMEFMQAHWSPSARLVAGVTGAGLVLYGRTRSGMLGTLIGGIGAALLARAAFNVELRRLFGGAGERGAITVQKTIDVTAPVDEVFDLWSRYENFPRFMSHVREVRRLSDDRSQWVVSGPAGVPVTWQTVETHRVPNELIAWRTEPQGGGDTVTHAGTVRFQPTAYGGTRLHITMSYTPVGGAIGHGMAALLGADPKHAMDEDLVRFKSLFEHGKTTAREGTVRREELA